MQRGISQKYNSMCKKSENALYDEDWQKNCDIWQEFKVKRIVK